MSSKVPQLVRALIAAPESTLSIASETKFGTQVNGVIFITQSDGIRLGVLCSFEVHEQWHVVQPRVWCYEPWFRRGNIDWHSYQDGSLCWELDDQWRVHLRQAAEELTATDLATHAAEYLLNSTRSLLQRHLTGHQLGLVEWPREWECWAHGNAGRKQFKATLQR